ncbi:MAG TPA: hypothetical protein DCQ94_12420 [Nitrospira sp.]|nr:hypothetical protein [Nitrospira sp.]
MREATSFLPGRTGVIVIGHGLDLSGGVSSRMRKTSAAGVLASLSGSPYGGRTIRHVARCGLAGRCFCASCGVFCYRSGA